MRSRSKFYNDVGVAGVKSPPIPGTCRMFLSGMCDCLKIPHEFWKHRRKNEHWFAQERLVLEFVTLRLHKRYFRHRWDLEDMFLTNASMVFELFGRHKLMKEEFPDLFRACLKMEGEQAGRFCLALAKEIGYVDSCHEGLTLPGVWEGQMVQHR